VPDGHVNEIFDEIWCSFLELRLSVSQNDGRTTYKNGQSENVLPGVNFSLLFPTITTLASNIPHFLYSTTVFYVEESIFDQEIAVHEWHLEARLINLER
jgi:hypothetical protein